MSTKFGRYDTPVPIGFGPTTGRGNFGGKGPRGGLRKEIIIALAVISFLCFLGALAAFLVGGSSPGTKVVTDPKSVQVGFVEVTVPNRAVRAGTKLNVDLFRQASVASSSVVPNAVVDPKEVQDFYAKRDLMAGQQFSRDDLTKDITNTSLPLGPGNRAVSIEVDDTSGLEGHALPGTKVDVVLTFYEETNLVSKVIVQNARVLSYGGDTTLVGNRTYQPGANRRTSRTMTLEVSPRDALQISTARQLGRLSLLMRGADDEKAPNTLEINQHDIQDNKQPVIKKACRSGKMKMGGKDYVVDCDGTISEVVAPE